MKKSNIWEPVYKITPKVARALMDIEAAKTIVERTALPPAAEAELRRAARVRSTHFVINGTKGIPQTPERFSAPVFLTRIYCVIIFLWNNLRQPDQILSAK